MGNRTVLARIRRLGEQIVDRFECAVFAARLKMVDWLYGPEPPTEADREWQRERLCMGIGADAAGATSATAKSRGANASN
jgi:hypothetical protein